MKRRKSEVKEFVKTRLQNAVVNSELKLAIEQEAVQLFSKPSEEKREVKLPSKPQPMPQPQVRERPEIQDFHSAVDLDYDEAENELLPLA